MSSNLSLFAYLLSLSPLVAAQKCMVTFDGRVPSAFEAKTLDTAQNTMFSPNFTFGKGLTISDVVQLPAMSGSLFDVGNTTRPVEVTINDQSIFTPSANNVQVGFRRAELMIQGNNGTDASTTGVKTVHFSLMKDAAKPLNPQHEYQLMFLESANFATNQVVLKTGSIIGQNSTDPDMLQLFGNVNAAQVKTLFKTPFTAGVFHNFAMTMDFTKNTTQVFYSQGNKALKAQGQPLSNDVSGQGQYHFGVLKKGLNGNGDPKKGTQEAGINEAIIYGGIFQEDSSAGCVSLSPATAASTSTTPAKGQGNAKARAFW